jgi:hypothetical protein
MKSFGRRKVEAPQRMVHVARVKVRISGGDGMRLTPQRLAAQEPLLFALGRVLESTCPVVLHDR